MDEGLQLLRSVVSTFSKSGKQQGSGNRLLAKILRVGTVGGKLDNLLRATKSLLIFAVQQLRRHQHFVSRFSVCEERNGLEVCAHGHAPSVEVNDLRDWTIGPHSQAERNLRAGQIVAVKVLGYFDGGPHPQGLAGQGRPRSYGLPAGIVERRRLPVLQIARVVAPVGRG